MKPITEEMIIKAIENGFSREDAEKGYGVFTSDYGNGATHIERLDCMMVFNSDEEASEQAEKDGIKIIHDMEFDDENSAYYIDTPENRKLLKDLVIKNNYIDKLEEAMQNEDFWVELNTYLGTIILHGKNTNSIADNEYYEVSSEINTDGDFAITFFKTYEKMKRWFDEWQGEGFYNYLAELYEEQLK